MGKNYFFTQEIEFPKIKIIGCDYRDASIKFDDGKQNQENNLKSCIKLMWIKNNSK